MKRVRCLALLLLALPALGAGLRGAVTLEPPPGWADANADGKIAHVLIVLKGPEASSFIVKRAPSVPLDNTAGLRHYLNEVLAGMRDASGRDYKSNGRVETKVFRNGLSASLLRAQEGGEDRVVLAVFSANGVANLAVLMSAAPEAMLPSLLGSLQYGAVEGEIMSSGVARSLDGQLELALGGGLRARSLLDAETGKGFVLVIQGAGSEILFQKLSEADATKPGEQAAIVRELAAASAGAAAAAAAPVRAAPTAAGPVGVYSWAPSAAGEKIAVGYLPWGYWGYQLFGRGPSADELLLGTLAALKAGPMAVPGLLAATPDIPIKEDGRPRGLALGAFAAIAGLGAAALLIWSLRRKNANLPG